MEICLRSPERLGLVIGVAASILAVAPRCTAEESAAPRTQIDTPAVRVENVSYGRAIPRGLFVSGYVQAEYQSNQASEDQLDANGQPLNQNRFLVRRARIRVDRAWDWAAGTVELDANTVKGATVTVRRAEAAILVRGETKDNEAPLFGAFLGVTEIPFGYEMAESNRVRWFMERTQASRAFFPGDPDVGLRLAGAVSFIRYSLAAMNGQPLDDTTFSARDPNAAKDLIGRVGVDTSVGSHVRVVAGTSFLRGTGFHPGTAATKPSLAWKDANQNGAVDAGEVTGVPGTAATNSANFARWAVGADLRFFVDSPLGRTTLAGEFTLAQNLDRGFQPADPIATGGDVRELGYSALVVQEFMHVGLVGIRGDWYDPNLDALDSRTGKLLPSSQQVRTLSPLVGYVWPGHGRLVAQYDFIQDALARDARGVPTDQKNNRLTLRAQVEL